MFNINNIWPLLWNFVNEDTPKTANITRVNNIRGKILNIPFIDCPEKTEAQENTSSRFRPLRSTSAQNLIRRR